MSEIVETVDVQNPAHPKQKLTIKRSEYDEDVHTLWEADDDEDEPLGPPMMVNPVIGSGDSLPAEPNAAVIEAPGSLAAQMIQAARGQHPVDLAGPQTTRAEQETRRAAEVRRMAAEAEEVAQEREKERAEAEKDKDESAGA